MTSEHQEHQQPAQWRKNVSNWVFLGFLAVAAFFLLSEHRAHALGWLPWLILLACPLMHIFMHRDHGHGNGAGRGEGGHRHE